MYNAAFTCTTPRRAARLPAQIRTPHKGKFFLDMIEHPVALFQALHGNFFYLGSCVQMQLNVNALPTVLAQIDDVLNRVALLLPARIREGFCDRPLGKIEQIGETERYEIAGKTSVILNAFVEQLFHLTWDVDRVPYCFHKKFLPRLIAFVKKSIHGPPCLVTTLKGEAFVLGVPRGRSLFIVYRHPLRARSISTSNFRAVSVHRSARAKHHVHRVHRILYPLFNGAGTTGLVMSAVAPIEPQYQRLPNGKASEIRSTPRLSFRGLIS